MPNSLEFINKEIERMNNIIRITKNYIALYTENKRDTAELKIKLTVLKNHLNSLQQIKTILEAWKVMKKHLEHFPSDYNNGIPKEIITMTSKIDEKDYPIIKKALEVKNEKEN